MSQNNLTLENVMDALTVNPRLTNSDLAAMFGVHRSTIYRLRKKHPAAKQPTPRDIMILQKARGDQDKEKRAIKTLARRLANAGFNLDEARKIFEFFMTIDALSVTNGNRTITATLLGESRFTVIRRLNRLGFNELSAEEPDNL